MSSAGSRISSLRGIAHGVRVGIAALLGDESARRHVVDRVVHSKVVAPYVEWTTPDAVPPAQPPPETLPNGSADPVVTEPRDWRSYFVSMLVGNGLEIGPLHEPLPKHSGASVVYVDRLPLAELLKHYPELPVEDLVDPDIIDDAESLRTIPNETYDFVSAAHVIEHMRNPIAALENWFRVLKPAGLLYLVVPDKRVTFDRARSQTPLEHMLLDYYAPRGNEIASTSSSTQSRLTANGEYTRWREPSIY